jgi:undecaprenyl diphosphate synthase
LNSSESSASDLLLDPSKLPRHVAVIMDGNGRWAKKRLLNRIKGHEKGVEAVRTIVRTCRELGIFILTLYAFSTENWQRSKSEIAALMTLLERFLNSERQELMENNIRLNAIGQIERLPNSTRSVLEKIMDLTKDNESMILNLALSYGGRDEILKMVRRIADKIKSGELEPEAITSEHIVDHLYTGQMADPDILIRTSGEMRVSNFMLWQIAYSEIFITPTLWPDFTRDEFFKILFDFQNRERRFGRV